MKRQRKKHIAARIGDHTGRERDIAPGKTPVTLYTDDGELWTVCDLDTALVSTVRRAARREGTKTNILLSSIVVEGFERLVRKEEPWRE